MASPSLLRRFLLAAVSCLVTLSIWLHLSSHIDSSNSKTEIELLMNRANHLLKGIQSHHQAYITGAPCATSLQDDSAEVLSLKSQLKEMQASLNNLQPHISTGKSNMMETMPSSSSPLSKWLVIGMPTVPRPNDEDYLITTLSRIHEQLPITQSDLQYLQILVHVVYIKAKENVKPRHIRFEEAKRKFADSPYFKFSELPSPQQPPGLAMNDVGNPNFPGYRVRKQTRDLAVRITEIM